MRTHNDSQQTSASLDKFKWLLVFVLFAFVVWGNFYFAEPNTVYQANLLVRVISIVVISVLALFLASTTQKGKSLILFAKESRTELRKVVWPSRKETTQTTLIVGVITVVVGLCLWGVDTLFIWAISILTTLGH